jgi:hypothetical protein
MSRTVQIATLLAAAACGGLPEAAAPDAADALSVVATLQPQSFVHGTLTAAAPQIAFAFNGTAGDVIAPDVWPTAAGTLAPTLTLLGPRGRSGHRAAIAAGSPRDGDTDHVALDGFRLPSTGNYLVVVGSSIGAGMVTVRLWLQSSHAPRQESAQVDLRSRPSAAALGMVAQHGAASAWSDADVDGIVASLPRQPDPLVALSDAQLLLSSLSAARSDGGATDAQLQRARDGALQLLGTARQFGALSPAAQSFALWWLGELQPALFDSAEVTAPANVAATIHGLVSQWGGVEDASGRHVRAKSVQGVVYGYVAEWAADQSDADGKPVWTWYSHDYFDASGSWLGEQTAGASEPDDGGR